MLSPFIHIAPTSTMGNGVFCTAPIEPGTIVEISPVVVMSAEDRKLLDQTKLHDYIFEWGADKDLCAMALGYISLYNHSYKSNCEYEMDFDLNMISIKAVHYIKAGEELFINYNGGWNDKTPIWFDAK